MTKFIELRYIEDNKEKIITINTDHIILFKPDTEDENHTLITLTKVYPSNGSIRNSIIKTIVNYNEIKSLLFTT
jgi:hypothetical protein